MSSTTSPFGHNEWLVDRDQADLLAADVGTFSGSSKVHAVEQQEIVDEAFVAP